MLFWCYLCGVGSSVPTADGGISVIVYTEVKGQFQISVNTKMNNSQAHGSAVGTIPDEIGRSVGAKFLYSNNSSHWI